MKLLLAAIICLSITQALPPSHHADGDRALAMQPWFQGGFVARWMTYSSLYSEPNHGEDPQPAQWPAWVMRKSWWHGGAEIVRQLYTDEKVTVAKISRKSATMFKFQLPLTDERGVIIKSQQGVYQMQFHESSRVIECHKSDKEVVLCRDSDQTLAMTIQVRKRQRIYFRADNVQEGDEVLPMLILWAMQQQ